MLGVLFAIGKFAFYGIWIFRDITYVKWVPPIESTLAYSSVMEKARLPAGCWILWRFQVVGGIIGP